ncbi:response regulator transcription factor [Algoriphagus aquimarinus]|uniref:DNA-binding response regulator, NarL/FixJ family, contains REC and HTH domains n=1 Tax=Algoriphagus aquimarinus TaxID=237018 RepID=A0A1I1BLR0_9BACT|nr:response regulator transcription factor [Algoriphagus aquimarinus]SFB50556.1 DNA-binding response regulator, NarL/FixJ family, contains REC and HTH domains [Algoriphagus aquimarinus]
MNKKISLYIADDHPIVVDGLREILKSNQQLIVKDVAHDGEQLIKLIESAPVDLVILDINMPKMNGIQCTKWIKDNQPDIRVIILTMYPEKTYIDQLLKAGADGCLLKSRGSSDLLEAIDRVMYGKSYFDWITDFKTDLVKNESKLSEREIEIVKLIVGGKTSSEIANLLFISEATVKTHRKNIFKKLKIHHATELLNFALNNSLL